MGSPWESSTVGIAHGRRVAEGTPEAWLVVSPLVSPLEVAQSTKKRKVDRGQKRRFFFSGWVRNNKKSVFFLNIYFLKVAFVVNLGVV